uniref:Uncharacterized protein n=1 Tax=Anguilla anguilla TaxID=7936 RepID=A0A0E9WD38_ANGAN
MNWGPPSVRVSTCMLLAIPSFIIAAHQLSCAVIALGACAARVGGALAVQRC